LLLCLKGGERLRIRHDLAPSAGGSFVRVPCRHFAFFLEGAWRISPARVQGVLQNRSVCLGASEVEPSGGSVLCASILGAAVVVWTGDLVCGSGGVRISWCAHTHTHTQRKRWFKFGRPHQEITHTKIRKRRRFKFGCSHQEKLVDNEIHRQICYLARDLSMLTSFPSLYGRHNPYHESAGGKRCRIFSGRLCPSQTRLEFCVCLRTKRPHHQKLGAFGSVWFSRSWFHPDAEAWLVACERRQEM
jgi:hypothetical protein